MVGIIINLKEYSGIQPHHIARPMCRIADLKKKEISELLAKDYF